MKEAAIPHLDSFIKNDPQKIFKEYEYKSAANVQGDNRYSNLISNLEKNGIGVNKVIETANSVGLELTQFKYSNLQLVEEIIYRSSRDAGIKKEIKKI